MAVFALDPVRPNAVEASDARKLAAVAAPSPWTFTAQSKDGTILYWAEPVNEFETPDA